MGAIKPDAGMLNVRVRSTGAVFAWTKRSNSSRVAEYGEIVATPREGQGAITDLTWPPRVGAPPCGSVRPSWESGPSG